jgi:phosphatidylglycerol:prolipoprotein diacylglycerol transferase
MTESIGFPNLGITLEHVGKTITIHGFSIAYYGIIIGCAILLGILIAAAEAKRTGQKPDDYYDFAIYAVIISIISARIYYVVFSWDMYKDDLKSIVNIRQGGLAIYGGIIGAILTVFVYAKIKKMSFATIFDTAVLGLVTGQIIGRWGNFFNREAFGEYTNSLLAMKLPVDAVRASDITEKMRQHMEIVDGISYIQVHPTFLYESLWNTGVLIILLLYRRHKKFEGELFLMYLFGYGLGRVWIEGLRTDQLLLPGTSIPVSQLLSACMIVLSAVTILYQRRKKHS